MWKSNELFVTETSMLGPVDGPMMAPGAVQGRPGDADETFKVFSDTIESQTQRS